MFVRVISIVFFTNRIFCATWNVNGRSPPLTMDPLLREYDVKGDKGSSQPDIYAIG